MTSLSLFCAEASGKYAELCVSHIHRDLWLLHRGLFGTSCLLSLALIPAWRPRESRPPTVVRIPALFDRASPLQRRVR